MAARNIFLLVVLGAIWGGSFIFIRLAAPDMGVVPMSAARIVIAALIMMAVIARSGGFRVLLASGRPVFMIGLLNTAIPFCMMAYATQELSANVASILNATVPVWAMVLGIVWMKNKPDAARILGVIIALLGVIVLVSGKPGFTLTGALVPTLSGLGAAFLYALASHYTRRYAPTVDPVLITAGSLMAAAVALTPAGIYFWPHHGVSLHSWIYVVVLAVVGTILAYFIYFRILREEGPERVVLVTYLFPPFAALWAYLFLGETITPQMGLGGLVVVAGTAMASGLLPLRIFGQKEKAA